MPGPAPPVRPRSCGRIGLLGPGAGLGEPWGRQLDRLPKGWGAWPVSARWATAFVVGGIVVAGLAGTGPAVAGGSAGRAAAGGGSPAGGTDGAGTAGSRDHRRRRGLAARGAVGQLVGVRGAVDDGGEVHVGPGRLRPAGGRVQRRARSLRGRVDRPRRVQGPDGGAGRDLRHVRRARSRTPTYVAWYEMYPSRLGERLRRQRR